MTKNDPTNSVKKSKSRVLSTALRDKRRFFKTIKNKLKTPGPKTIYRSHIRSTIQILDLITAQQGNFPTNN